MRQEYSEWCRYDVLDCSSFLKSSEVDEAREYDLGMSCRGAGPAYALAQFLLLVMGLAKRTDDTSVSARSVDVVGDSNSRAALV